MRIKNIVEVNNELLNMDPTEIEALKKAMVDRMVMEIDLRMMAEFSMRKYGSGHNDKEA